MASTESELFLPRPGSAPSSGPSKPPVPGPSEAAFTETFGKLLPPAKYLQTANGKAAYYELATPASSTQTQPDRVLFIHGVQTPALGLVPLARALQPSFPQAHLVLFDLWGHGLSDTPILPHEPGLFHQLIDALLDHLGWPSAHLIGYSFGGSLTAGYVASRPARVQSFTIIAPAGVLHFATDFTPEEQAHLRGGGSSDDEVAARKWVVSWLEGGELVVPADWKERVGRGEVVAEAVRDWETRNHPGHTASVVGVFRDGAVMDNDVQFAAAARTGIPALAVLGELDTISNKAQLEELGFTNVAVVPQAGHAVSRQNAPEVAALIGEFWKVL
ncbi:Alpha/Beta hydrolase protein [Xylariales sp. PMI_506]|nr:Alpha/Beta hydrolase protein [Xylariales sp. PMI_506]